MRVENFDAVIIGAGQAGGPLSTALGEAGWRTAIIEREHAGGTCVNTGCTPTKTMIASARVAHLVSRSADYGVNVGPQTVDLEVVRKRKRDMVEMFRSGSESRIRDGKNVELIFGEASFLSPNEVAVVLDGQTERRLRASTIVINAGGRPRAVNVPGLSAVDPLNSTSIMELESVPGRLLVVGGGAVGVEFAQMFARFGSKVTLLEHGSQILSQEDRDVSDAVAEILTEDGVDVRFEAELEEVVGIGAGKVARVRLGGSSLPFEFDEILIAAGRTPNSDRLNCTAAGIETDDAGYIVADANLETNVPGIYALGDIHGGPAFTHVAYDDFRILRDRLISDGSRTREGRVIPYIVFTDPQLGRVGMTEKDARASGVDVQIFRLPMSSVARALEVDETRGFMKAVVDRATGRIVGTSILGIEAGEVSGAIQVAMMGNLHYSALRDGIFPHPTLAESLNSLFNSPDDA